MIVKNIDLIINRLRKILDETNGSKGEISFFNKKSKEKITIALELGYEDEEEAADEPRTS